MYSFLSSFRRRLTFVLLFVLVGCTTAKQHIHQDLIWHSDNNKTIAAQRVNELIALPLTADDAVQIALLNHRALQAKFFKPGISEYEATQQTLSLAAKTRKAYYTAVAANQTVLYMQQVKEAADAGAELAKRLLQVGNFNKLQQAREQSFYAEAVLDLTRAKQMQVRSREKLTRLLALPDTTYSLPSRLPDLPKTPQELVDIEQRLDEVAINTHEVQEAYSIYRANFDMAKYFQDEIVPLKKRVSEENLLRYNGMLISVFDLLADARSQIVSVNSAIEASRDFWIAKTDLELSLMGVL